jgi:hypothetical protein
MIFVKLDKGMKLKIILLFLLLFTFGEKKVFSQSRPDDKPIIDLTKEISGDIDYLKDRQIYLIAKCHNRTEVLSAIQSYAFKLQKKYDCVLYQITGEAASNLTPEILGRAMAQEDYNVLICKLGDVIVFAFWAPYTVGYDTKTYSFLIFKD